MSETAQTLIKSALRSIGAIATGETPTASELDDGLESLQFMLRSWSARNIRLWYTKQESLSLTGAASYTIGSGGDLSTVRPTSIRGAWTTDGPVKIIDEAKYRRVRMDSGSAIDVEWLWYSPEYPLGVLYPWGYGSGTLYLDTLKPFTDPTAITSSVAFPPEYDEAIKYNLAVRLAPEFGREAPQTVVALAGIALAALENKNFAEQINAATPEIIRLASNRYNIDNA